MKRKRFARIMENLDLFVVEVDGIRWVSDKYWLMPYDASPAQELLNWWNLDGVGKYHVTDSRPEFIPDAKLPDITPVLAMKPTTVVKPRLIGEKLCLVDMPNGLCVVLDVLYDGTAKGDEQPRLVRRDYLDLIAPDWRTAEITSDSPTTAIRINGSYAMPVRVE